MSLIKRSDKRYGRKAKPFVMFSHEIVDSENYLNLSYKAVRLLIDLQRQYNGSNNGDLCIAWSVMAMRRWRSRETLYRALKELLYYEFIELTRQGGKNRCSLYAVTYESIDHCNGKLHVSETRRASNRWRKTKPKYQHNERHTKMKDAA